MSEIFIKIFNLGLTAGWLVLAILVCRPLMRKAPKWISCLLWGIVGLRLCLPFSLESVFSLVPSAEPLPKDIVMTPTPVINSGVGVLNDAVNPIISTTLAPDVGASVNPMQIVVAVASWVWVIGIALMLGYGIVSYISLRLKVRASVRGEGKTYFCDEVDSPFILGVIRPRIYVPSGMNGEALRHVLAHEKAHLRRGDHLWKPIGFAVLAFYWFNPLLWVAYAFLCRDIEAACDEKVIKTMPDEAKKSYSEALLACSLHRRKIMACPLAFGEVGVKQRIKSVLNYKKPAFWVIIAALIATLIISVCFLTNPRGKVSELLVPGSDWYTNSGLTASFYVNYDGTIEGWMDTVDTIFNISLYYRNTPFGDAVVDIYRGTRSQTDAGEAEIVIKGELKKDGDSLVIEIDSNELGLTTDKLVFHRRNKEPYEIGALHQAYIAGSPAILIRISDYGCEAENIGIEMEDVVIDQDGIAFRILWHNLSDGMYDISHDFKVYRYYGNKLIELERIEHDGYYVEEAVAWVTMAKSKSIRDYHISRFYDISESGNYRFECRDAWVEFEVMTVTEALMNLDSSDGLDVIVWQMAQGNYSFSLRPHSDEKISYSEIIGAGVTAAEMRAILTAYDTSDIYIVPWQNPISSYIGDYWIAMTTDEDITPQQNMYIAIIRDMILGKGRAVYPDVCEIEIFDIDGDGKDEICHAALGLVDGKFSFSIKACESGEPYEYFDTFYTEPMSLKFFEDESGKVRLRGVTEGGEAKNFDISIKKGHVKLTEIDKDKDNLISPQSVLNLSELDLSLVDRIVITNVATGEKVYLRPYFNKENYYAILDAVKDIRASNPVSNRGYSEFAYNVELYFDFQEIYSFAVYSDVSGSFIICGCYETVGGVDYPCRYRLMDPAYADLIKIFGACFE